MSDSWQQHTITELCEMVKGSAPISKTKAGQFPLVTTGAERKTADRYQFDAAVVCVPMISSTGHGHASLKRVHYQEGKFALANLLTALIVRDQTTLSPRFLHLYLNFYKDQLIVPLQSGAANMSITVGRLATVPVRFPSLTEQERILRIVDEADELRRLRAQADRRTAALVPAIFDEMFGDLISNSKGWRKMPFGEVCECRLGKMLDAKQQTGQHKRPYLRNVNVQWGQVDLSEVFEMDFDERSREILRLRVGDVLICEGGEIGRSAIWHDELPECYYQKALHRARPHASLAVSEFILWSMWFLAKRGGFSRFTGQSTIAHLTGEKLKALSLPLPPLTLQQQFAARVAEVRQLEESQAASRRKHNALFDSLLHRAFRGEL
jgi:type I restriction enzyme S subunit